MTSYSFPILSIMRRHLSHFLRHSLNQPQQSAQTCCSQAVPRACLLASAKTWCSLANRMAQVHGLLTAFDFLEGVLLGSVPNPFHSFFRYGING